MNWGNDKRTIVVASGLKPIDLTFLSFDPNSKLTVVHGIIRTLL